MDCNDAEINGLKDMEETVKMSEDVMLGEGVLGWNREERVSDRYGSVILFTNAIQGCSSSLSMTGKVKEGAYGELIAVVVETRASYHIGDLFRGIFPSTPNEKFL